MSFSQMNLECEELKADCLPSILQFAHMGLSLFLCFCELEGADWRKSMVAQRSSLGEANIQGAGGEDP